MEKKLTKKQYDKIVNIFESLVILLSMLVVDAGNESMREEKPLPTTIIN